MTTPIQHGYPDYGRFSAQSDVILFSVNSEAVNPSIDHGPFFCAGFQYVALTMSPDTKSFQYQLIWTNDAAGTTTLAIDGAIMPIASSNTLVFPVLGPWLIVRATPRTAPGSHGLVVFVVPTGASLVGANADAATFTAGGGVTVGAGLTTTFNYTQVFAGQASVWSRITATAGAINILVADLAGNYSTIALASDTIVGMPKASNFQLFIPPRPLRVDCINLDAVARDFTFAIVGRPFHGGR